MQDSVPVGTKVNITYKLILKQKGTVSYIKNKTDKQKYKIQTRKQRWDSHPSYVCVLCHPFGFSYLVLEAFSTCSARAFPNARKEQLCSPRFHKHTLLHSILFFHFHVSNMTLPKVEEHANGVLT